MSRHDFINNPMNIVQDHVAAWDQDQSNSRGKEDAEAETDGHRGEMSCLAACLQEHRGEPAEGGQRCQNNGPKSECGRL